MLINCVAYEDGAKLADMPIDDISEYVSAAAAASSGWRSRTRRPKSSTKMQQEFGLHDLAVEDARHGHQRPKIEEYGDTLFVVLHTVGVGPTDDLSVGEVDVFVGPNFVLSVRNRTPAGLSRRARARRARAAPAASTAPAFVLYALMDAVVDRYFPIIDALETELEAIEDQIFEPHLGRANIERLYALKQRGSVRQARRRAAAGSGRPS